MTDCWEKRQQEIRQGTASHLRFNNNIYIASLKWGHQRAWQDGKSNQIEWVSERETRRERKRENEGRKDCQAILPCVRLCVKVWLRVCFCVLGCQAASWVQLPLCVCTSVPKSVLVYHHVSTFIVRETAFLHEPNFVCVFLSSLRVCTRVGVCARHRTSTEEKEEEVMEEQTYKAQNGATRTEIKSESLREMEEREQELNQVNRETERERERGG